MKRKKIEEEIESYTDLDKSAFKIIEMLQQYIKEYGNSVFIKGTFAGYDGGHDYHICYYRDETDKEYESRLKREKKDKEDKEKKNRIKEERERAKLAELKVKYE